MNNGKRILNTDSNKAPPSKRRRDEDGDSAEPSAYQIPDFTYNSTFGEEAESGIIERIFLKNFMSHTWLDFSFGPKINFIGGCNSSGKSAVLTALVIGLGGKATMTNRGSAVRSFIKDGTRSGEISIQLRNRGCDAYKPDKYGKHITIERRLTADSSSNYKIKSAAGEVVSIKQEELRHIVDHFNIQVDNPVTILNQDTSKNFLHSTNSSDKYKFFLKATQLEQIQCDYVLAKKYKIAAEGILQQKEQTMPELEREVWECEQQFKALSSLDELQNKVKQLKNEMAWAFVSAKEKEVESALKDYKQEEARTPTFAQKVEEVNAKVEACLLRQKSIQDQVRVLTEEANELDPRYQEAKKVCESKKKAIQQMQLDLRKVTNELNSCEQDRDQILERIDEIRNSAPQDYKAERRAREERIAHLEEQVAAMEATKKTTEHQLDQFASAVSQYKEQQYRIRAEEQDIRHKMDQTWKNVTTMKSARNDRLKRFGQWMPAVQQKIQEAYQRGQFHQKPRGPIGVSISLREGKWALGVEKCLSSLIHAFCCNDHHDGALLEGIFAEFCQKGRKPSTIISRFHNTLYDVSQNRPVTDRYPTVLDMLDIQDPVVGNCLIDQRGIESILLFENVEEARTVMGRDPIKNCREAFALTGDQLLSHPTFRYYSCQVDFKARFLTANIEDDIRVLEQEFVAMQQDQHRLAESMNKVNRDIQTNQHDERTYQTRLNKLHTQLGKLNFEIREVKNQEDPTPVDVKTLEDEVKKYNDMLARLQEKKTGADDASAAIKQELDQAEHEFREIHTRLRAITERAEPLKERLAEEDSDVELNKSHRLHYETKMIELQNKIATAKAKYENKKTEFEEDTLKAEQMCEKIKTRRTLKSLESEIQQINKCIQTEEKR